MRGLSPRNLNYMRPFAAAWPNRQIVQEVLAQITWHDCIALLDKVKETETRLSYVRKARVEDCSRNDLAMQIERRLHERRGTAVTNFAATLPSRDHDLATQTIKDPYLFDVLVTTGPRRERQIEHAPVDDIQSFLLEFGTGFAFVGKQVLLKVVSCDFYADLLFLPPEAPRLRRLRTQGSYVRPCLRRPYEPLPLRVDDPPRHPDDEPTDGTLLCKSKDRLVVEYAQRTFCKPMGVAESETHLVESLPDELKGSLPTVAEIEAELDRRENREL